ncbi:hypothetical protein BU17DRAFT_95468 [Hysterangium stoloniferum]|nr:hypothetical protein BU17DRAFT_95468 [Hysterangium stoloniferum]
MPFSTDANWPQRLLNIFDVSRNQNTPLESRYYGRYDWLFNYAVIEGSFTFLLAPRTAPDENSARDAVNFIIFMVVLNHEQKPVLIAEIKDDRWANKPDKRQRVDTQDAPAERSDATQLPHSSPAKSHLTLLDPNVDRILPPDFLGAQWDLDILSRDGLKKIQESVRYIKAETNVVGQ